MDIGNCPWICLSGGKSLKNKKKSSVWLNTCIYMHICLYTWKKMHKNINCGYPWMPGSLLYTLPPWYMALEKTFSLFWPWFLHEWSDKTVLTHFCLRAFEFATLPSLLHLPGTWLDSQLHLALIHVSAPQRSFLCPSWLKKHFESLCTVFYLLHGNSHCPTLSYIHIMPIVCLSH